MENAYQSFDKLTIQNMILSEKNIIFAVAEQKKSVTFNKTNFFH